MGLRQTRHASYYTPPTVKTPQRTLSTRSVKYRGCEYQHGSKMQPWYSAAGVAAVKKGSTSPTNPDLPHSPQDTGVAPPTEPCARLLTPQAVKVNPPTPITTITPPPTTTKINASTTPTTMSPDYKQATPNTDSTEREARLQSLAVQQPAQIAQQQPRRLQLEQDANRSEREALRHQASDRSK